MVEFKTLIYIPKLLVNWTFTNAFYNIEINTPNCYVFIIWLSKYENLNKYRPFPLK